MSYSPPIRALADFLQGPEAPRVEQQRRTIVVVQVLHLADPEHVVAGGVDVDDPADEVGESAVEQR